MKTKLLFFIMLIMSMKLLWSQVKYNEEFRINQYSDDSQCNSQSVVLSDGKFVICWESHGGQNSSQDGDEGGIVAQIFNSDCSRFSSEFVVNSYTNDKQRNPRIASLQDGNFVICWESAYQDGSDWGVYAQIFNNNGKKIDDEFKISKYTKGDQWSAEILDLTDNTFIICWRDGKQYSEDDSQSRDGWKGGIFAQIFKKSGEKICSEFQVNDIYQRDDSNQLIHKITNEIFLITWNGWGEDGFEIFGKLFKNNGETFSSEFQINSFTDRLQWRQKVVAFSDGTFMVCWESDQNKLRLHEEICVQVFNVNGNKIGEEININTYTNAGQRKPEIITINDEHILVFWECEEHNHCIKAQAINKSGEKIGSEFQIDNYHKGWLSIMVFPKALRVNNDQFIIFWNQLNPGETESVYAQIFDNNLKRIGNNFKMADNHSERYLKNSQILQISESKILIHYEPEEEYWSNESNNVFAKYFLINPINHSLNNFSLISPEYDVTMQTITPTFTWNKTSDIPINLSWEIFYDLYISKNEDFSYPIIIHSQTDTTHQLKKKLNKGQIYYWKILATNCYGDSLWSSETNGFFVSNTAVTNIEEENTNIISGFQLHQNYPNPFNPSTKISYSLPKSEHVTLKIYNMLGEEIKTMVNEIQNIGTHTISFDATGSASGIYFYKLQVSGEFVETRKMIYLR